VTYGPVDIIDIDHRERDGIRQKPDATGEPGASPMRVVTHPKALGITHTEAPQSARLAPADGDGGEDHRSEHWAATGFVQSEHEHVVRGAAHVT
jgi:hypothetical protein